MRNIVNYTNKSSHSGDEEDVLSSELLLELANEARLDLLELLKLGVGNIDDDALLVSNLDLLKLS